MSIKRIVFLDIDGVLNSFKTAKKGGFGGWFKEETEEPTLENVNWGQDLVDNLRSIVDATNAEIVISSTWRRHFSIDCFKKMFALYGWENPPIIGKTVLSNKKMENFYIGIIRGEEIQDWLDDEQVDRYVIIDDTPDFREDQLPFFVQTDMEVGLTKEDAELAIKILNN